MLVVKNLNLVYPDGDKQNIVLSDINFRINESETVVFVGPSGSGKSSLIYLLAGLKKPTSGNVIFNGNVLSGKNDTAKERYENFGFIFQQHFLIPYLTVLENVCVAIKSKDSRIKSIEILKKLGLEDHLNKKPHQLSGGQRQRVAIARALVKNPKILFADEPTASLDHTTALEVMALLRNMKNKTTLIMATHDTSLLSPEDRVVTVYNHMINENLEL